jgi:uncharacterized protein (UPF0333 family)
MKKKKGQQALEYLLTYGWAILIIIVVVGALFMMGVFKTSPQEDYNSETKAFRTEEYACDLYLEYEGNRLMNITLLDCIKRWD